MKQTESVLEGESTLEDSILQGDFIFYQGFDSLGGDLCYMENKSIDELKNCCLSLKKAVGFNSLGFIKYFVYPEKQFKKLPRFVGENEGLYVVNKRYIKQNKIIKNKSCIEFQDYKFYPNMDSKDSDSQYFPNKTIYELKEMCDKNIDLKGFSSLGFLKASVLPEGLLTYLNHPYNGEGLYIKKKKIRIKMLCNWCTSEQLCHEWNRMSQGNFRWNDIEITWHNDVDYFIIINKPLNNQEFFIPQRTIVFQMEPWCSDPSQKWGVKTWGFWAQPEESLFLHVRTHRNYYNNCFWQLNRTYNEFKTKKIKKDKSKGELVSSICSSKYFDPGHIKRIDFLKYIEAKDDQIVRVDIYNHDNKHKFKNYKGPHPINNKDIGIMPYKYYFMAENNNENNFITEKIWEPLLCESLCFYYGAPNIFEYIDPRAIILLDLDDFEESFNIMKEAILTNQWERRLEFIRREKQKVLEYYNFFPTVERVLLQDLRLKNFISDENLIYHKYFHKILDEKMTNICFIHNCNINNNGHVLLDILDRICKSGLIKELDYIFILNLGPPLCKDQLSTISNKIQLINYSRRPNLFEKPSINLIRIFSLFNPDTNILYLHSKGVSYYPIPQGINDWRNYMIHFLVDRHKQCLELLTEYDTVGCDYSNSPKEHYSGNFWWARGEYIATLNEITSDDRHDCEWWILGNQKVNKYAIFNSHTDHYQNEYPPEMYINK